jgi:hypothetical protein
MRQRLTLVAILTTVLIAAAGPAYGQPPDVVQSDDQSNTAMGTGALQNNRTGSGNTAAGFSAMAADNFGDFNTAFGVLALNLNTTGSQNVAVGGDALSANISGYSNVAVGYQALTSNTEGGGNVAVGGASLELNTSGLDNAAVGNYALAYNTTGSSNTAMGSGALMGACVNPGGSTCETNSTGSDNAAYGAAALTNNTTGNKNTAAGYESLYSNSTGSYNTATGYEALYYNIDGIRNSASGDWGLYSNTHGSDNTAAGQAALYSNTTGSSNIGLGANSGYNVTSGSNNIEIGNKGTSSDSGMIRIGTSSTQTATYIAGIENAKVTGAAVYVTSSGQLGVLASSERYKTGIAPMGAGTEKLSELRPVSFHLRTDPKGSLQYGLIAEEVARVYPELVIRDESGKIQGVRYDELAPMLLNEVQKQQTIVDTLVAQRDADAVKLETQAAKIASLEQQLSGIQAALVDLRPKHQLVAQR